jgi:Ca-activated chloride channel family protein
MNNNTPKILFGVLAAIMIIGALVFTRGGGSDDSTTVKSAPGDKAPAGAVVVDIMYSPEKEPLLVPAIKDFNSEGIEVDGKPVYVRGQVVASGAGYSGLVEGKLEPTIWSPSSSFWGRLINHTTGEELFGDDNPSLVRTPLVLAMWEDQAKALGWPKKEFGWSDMLQWSRDKDVFKNLGRPEWGQFKMGHTNPDFSTSGLSAVAAEYYAAAGKYEGLTEADLDKPGVREQVVDLQKSVVHYGDTTLFFADQLRKYGPAYASAVAMEEVTLVDYNQKRGKAPKLVAIYPKEGTFYSDNPLMIPNADWVSAAEREGAAKFTEYLLRPEFQERVGKVGMRPSDPDVDISEDISAKNGADPAKPTRVMALPTPSVLAKIKAYWKEDRKPADVVIVLDTSGSMLDEDKLVDAQRGLAEFIRTAAPQDRLSLVQFSSESNTLQGFTPMTKEAKQSLIGRVNGLYAEGGTAMYDATLEGVRLGQTGNDEHIKAVVVLSDGLDTDSKTSLNQLLKALDAGDEGQQNPVRVFTIAYGQDADPTAMARIAEAGNGKAYEGDPDTIEQVYLSISSFF